MTLPNDVIYPLATELSTIDEMPSLVRYVRNLVETLTERDRQIVDVVNGSVRQWTPTIKGSTTEGAGTYTYQVGWLLRQGLMVDLWYDVVWTAHTGTGDIQMTVPYQSANSEGDPWVGLVSSSDITWTAGYTMLLLDINPNSFDGIFGQVGSGLPTIALPMSAAGRLTGYIRYIGKEFEN